ncbi:phospholipase D family protein [Salisaeta longa]|uniref:phospholipase D family protein n=1 Tax=Salisaeta longa TaxID=503170 RepID=UPI0012F8CD4F|nr:phospholipase D family protein [Salisaeta longa]
MQRLIEACSSEQPVRAITRWRLDEIVSGASDPEIWKLLKDRPGASLWLRPDLHAKYYRFGDVCYAGSANITDAALGWSARPNFELLVRLPFRKDRLASIEGRLRRNCVRVSQDLYDHFTRLREEYEQLDDRSTDYGKIKYDAADVTGSVAEFETELDVEKSEQIDREQWLPHLRHPEKLYRTYTGDFKSLTTATRRHGLRDLQFFDTPDGLPEAAFNMEIKWQLLQMPVVQTVDDYVRTSRRFGAVRDYLKTLPCSEAPGFNATEAWQTLMRWLLYFLGDRYKRRVYNYSEIIYKKHR